jgi:sigma-B regulation protein RsbU (phosphoserine phosphatase)
MHILIVNSEPETQQLLLRSLTSDEYEVTLWDSNFQDLDLSQLNEPTLVIADWQNGRLMKYLNQWQGDTSQVLSTPMFCLMLIPTDQVTDCPQAVAQGVDDWLSYPVDTNELRARVLMGQQTLKLKQALQEQKQILDTELAEAEAYVRSLLPGDLSDKIPINARFMPSRLLGGDGYDYYWLDPDYLVIYLLDVSGHGIGSALLSTSVLNMLRSQSLPDVNFYRPEKVLKALNDTFQMNDQNEKYFTMWYGVYNRANRQLLYASAGHPPAVLIARSDNQPQTVQSLKTRGLPIGMLPDVHYQWQRCQIPPDSRLYLFSDGVYEIKQHDNTIMGLDDFVEILAQQPAHSNVDDILTEVSSRNRDRTLLDDLSLLEVFLE